MTVDSLLLKYFPYRTWRKFQREIAYTVYDGLVEGDIVLIEAPTGIGKTSAVLAGALAYSEESDVKILYLVRTKSEAQAPLRELYKLRRKGIFIPYTILRSRLDMCCHVESKKMPYEEFVEECKYLRSSGKCQYYISAQRADIDLYISKLLEEELSPTEIVEMLCREGLCPYEISKRMMDKAKVIIMTYHYVFSVTLSETFDIDLTKSVLVIDEAHNLPQIIVDANSFSISELTVKACINEVKKYIMNEDLKNDVLKFLKDILSYMKKIKESRTLEEIERSYIQVDVSEVLSLFDNINVVKEAYIEIISRKRSQGAALPFSYLGRVLEFHRRLTGLGSQFAIFVSCNEGILELVCRCLDPAVVSSRVFSKVSGAVLMSGTLPPTDYVKTMLGIERYTRELRIPFREYVTEGRIRAVVYPGITTRYVERTEAMFEKIGTLLSAIYDAFNCNKAILAVFPSYSVLKTVRRYLRSDINYIMELSSTSVEQVISKLRENPKTLIMVVAGGKLMEGVEFKIDNKNLLGMVVIVGVPYPEPNDFLNMFKDIVSTRVGSSDYAWELVYLWNALIKIKQAIGRAIRSEKDVAYVLLMDRRFLDARIRKSLEEYLGELTVISDDDKLLEDIENFVKTNLIE